MKESALPVTISFVLRVPGRSLSFCGAERCALQNRVVVAKLAGRGELYTLCHNVALLTGCLRFLSRFAGGLPQFRLEELAWLRMI
jgi:hypothetical protein